MHHRVYMVLVTYMVVALSAYECMTSQHKQATYTSDLHTLEISSDTQKMDINEVELEKFNGTHPSSGFRSTWPSVLGAVTAVLSIILLIAVAVKYRLFQRCLPRNTHDLLLEGDQVSQFSHGALEGGVPVRGMRGRMINTSEDSSGEDDDDGFIEDNYIQASEREKAHQEDHQEDVEDTDDELIIPESDTE